MTVSHTTCPLCEAMCGLLVTTDAARTTVESIRPDPEDPLSRGGVCPKAFALSELHADPDRLRTPVRRTPSGWEPMSWGEALDFSAEGLHRVQREHGREAVASYLGNPNVHNLGSLLFAPAFVRMLSKVRFSATSLDQLPHQLVSWRMYGHQLLLPVPDIDRTGLLVIVGANPVASGGSLMTAPDVRNRLRAVQERGGRVVVVDPRRTETAKVADDHHFVRPGTDAAWLAAVLNRLLQSGASGGELADLIDGLDTLREAVAPWTAERAAAVTAMGEAAIEGMAEALQAAETAVVYGRIGVSTHPFGSTCQWLIQAINLVTGNLDREGGAMFTSPAVDLMTVPGGLGPGPGRISRRTTRVRGRPAVLGEFPTATMAEEMDTPGEGRVRALITIAGNPVLSAPHGRRIEAALEGLDFQVAVDPYINETTRHADVILPPVSPLQRSHYDLVFSALAVRNVAKFSPAVLAAGDDERQDWRILLGLESRLGRLREDGIRARSTRWLRGRLGPEGILEVGLRRTGLSRRALKDHPSGLDLGPLRSNLRARLPSGRIDAAPESLVADLSRLDESRAPVGLRLIGRRHARDCNSWMHNVPSLSTGRARCTLQIHPEDAAAAGVASGELAEVASRVGRVEVAVEVTDVVMPGVVSLPHGWGHDRSGTRMAVAAKRPGVSINDLTDDQALDPVSGNAAFIGVPVTVSKIETATTP